MIASANVSFSQDEYDDMYFNPNDRKEVKVHSDVSNSNVSSKDFDNNAIAKNTPQSDVINPSYSPNDYGDLEENYSAKNVNPEYIARYKNNPKGTAGVEEVVEGDSYYDDYYERALMPGEKEEDSKKGKYAYPSSYYGGHSTAMRTRMYGNPMYDPFYGGYGSGWNLGLGYTFGYMPGFSMSLGYGSGMGYNPYGFYDPFSPFANPYYGMSRYYNPYYSPWAYDPFYSPYSYNPYYSSMYGYGGMGYYCPSPYYGYGGYNSGLVVIGTSGSGTSSSNAIPESNRFESPSYRNRIARGSDQYRGDRTDVPNTRTVATRNNTIDESQAANARTANRDFSRSQNEYYNRSGSRNMITTASARSSGNRSTVTNIRSTSRNSTGNVNSARVRSSRVSSDYSRPSYKSTREQRSISSGRSSWSNSGTYRSSRSSSGSSYSTPSRSGGSSYNRSSGASYRSSSSSGSSSGTYSGGSRSSGSSGGSSRSSRGNR
jgi:hypothetical protein